jgi:hypothetical protein
MNTIQQNQAPTARHSPGQQHHTRLAEELPGAWSPEESSL